MDHTKKKVYCCLECGLHYEDEKLAKKCEAWCGEHRSCNLEITSHAVENKIKKIINKNSNEQRTK